MWSQDVLAIIKCYACPLPYFPNTILKGLMPMSLSVFKFLSTFYHLVCRGWYGNSWVAVKTVHTSGHDMTECNAEVNVCYRRCAEKLMQEAKMLHKLSHKNVIKVKLSIPSTIKVSCTRIFMYWFFFTIFLLILFP